MLNSGRMAVRASNDAALYIVLADLCYISLTGDGFWVIFVNFRENFPAFEVFT